MYISSSIDVVENVGIGNNCSSRSPKDNPVRENVEINSSNNRPAGEAPARGNVKTNVDQANVTRRQKPGTQGYMQKEQSMVSRSISL